MASHRGPHPEDEELFARSALPELRKAVRDLSWLRSRGYGDTASLKLVGDRYRLARRQRNAVARSACTDRQKQTRLASRVSDEAIGGQWVEVDGFNVIIAVEGALGGAYLFVGRDGAYRDVDPVRGTYRIVEETVPAITALRTLASALSLAGITWRLDGHVSNVGRLKTHLYDLSPSGMGWEVVVQGDVDEALCGANRLVASSDSAILDRVKGWCSLEGLLLSRLAEEVNVRDLRFEEGERSSRS